MTDFFADLEREIRAAHPRRSRPVVPVRGIAVTAAVAMTLVAVVLGIGALSPTAEEVATQPTPDPQPTAVMPADCNGKVVDGRIPDEALDRFAILRGDGPGAELRDEQVPGIAAEVIRQSLRRVDGPQGREYVFALVRMGDMNCEPSDHGICLIAPRDHFCTVLEEDPVLGYVVDDLPSGRRVVAVVAQDSVGRVNVSEDRRGVIAELTTEANVALQELPAGGDLRVSSAGEPVPSGCSTAPAMSPLKAALGIFRRAPDAAPAGFGVDLPQGWHSVHLDQVRRAGDEHLAFPATNASCDTGVCLVAADDPTAECQTLEEGDIVLMLVRREDGRARVAGLVRDGVETVELTSAGTTQEIEVQGNLVTFVAPSDEFEVEAGS